MGRCMLECGNRVLNTSGVQAPAANRTLVHGSSVLMWVDVSSMRMLESSLWLSVSTDTALAGWWSWTPRERQMLRRNWQNLSGFLDAGQLMSSQEEDRKGYIAEASYI